MPAPPARAATAVTAASPSGKTSSRTRLRLKAGAQIQVIAHSFGVANGSEPGEWTSVYRSYAKGTSMIAVARPIRDSSGPTG
jgi:hypothetical protein